MIIFIAGTFDVIHIGHINMLLHCRTKAGWNGKVVVSLDSDKKIRSEKGANRPIFSFVDRRDAIQSLKANDKNVVDIVTMHSSNDQLEEVIKLYSPDYIFAGGDYIPNTVVGSKKFNVAIFPRDCRFSSTKIIEACQKQK